MADHKRILTVVGARPQFIKAAVLSRFLKSQNRLEEDILHTGQHYDKNMSAVFFEELGIPEPKFNLEIQGGSHGQMTGRMLEGIEKVLLENSYDALLVYGDTNSTLAGALAAQKIGLPVIHVEAGLRSFNMQMPEEVNRILTDRLASLCCCPTSKAVENLKKEGFEEDKMVLTGDIMKDAVRYFSTNDKVETNHILVTIHRQENTDDKERLKAIFKALDDIGELHNLVFPIHPRTRKIVQELDLVSKIRFIDPVSYGEMQNLIAQSQLVITDSGGLQKEAYFHGKRVLVLRDETEWTELVDHGYALLAGADFNAIKENFATLIDQGPITDKSLYGNAVVENIYDAILDCLWES